MESEPQGAAPITGQPLDTDVVIIGAGPTGLMAAALLARCGLRTRILDKSEQPAHESRAFGLQAKSLELLLSLGLAERFLDRGVMATGAQIYVDGKQAAELNFDDIGRQDTPYSFLLMVPQSEIEALLVEDLKEHGLEVERGRRVTAIEQSSQSVVARYVDGSGSEGSLSAAYAIGADGAHSIVRRSLGLRFEGAPYPQNMLLADCKIDWPLDYSHFKLFLKENHFAVYLPLRGKNICRVVAMIPSDVADAPTGIEGQGSSPTTLAEVQAVFAAAVGLDVTLSDATWLTRYRVHHRGVDRYRVGRVFVAGDAAHIHSPAGGQGMNTGLQDAANLVWKLALVMRGHAPPGLLDTYNDERRPVGEHVLRYTDKLFSNMVTQTGWKSALRNRLVPLFAGMISKSGMMRARAFHFISQLGIRYYDSPWVRDASSAAAPREWTTGLTAGHRAPNAAIARGVDLFSLIGGYRFHVLALSRLSLDGEEIAKLTDSLISLPRSLGLELTPHLVTHSLIGRDPRIHRAESGQIFAAYGVSPESPRALFLIRPDGYIAWRSDSLDVEALRGFLVERFGAG